MTEPHLSLDALADLLAAEGSPADEAHVGSCAACAGRLDELAAAEEEVAAVLAALPAPPVPDDLAARLQAALAAEPPLVAAAAPAGAVPLGEDGRRSGAGTGAGATVTPFPAARRRRRAWAPAAAAAAVLVLVGGALAGTGLLSRGGSETTTSAVGGGAGGAADDGLAGVTRNETGTDYAADGTLAASLPALLGGSATAVTAPLAARDSAGPEADAAPETAPEAAPEAAVRSQRGTALDAARGDELDRLRTPAGLASCLAALLPPEQPDLRPLAVDYAAYAGQPALVVVLPAAGAADKVDVFVVGAGCTTGQDSTLLFTRLDRP